MVSSDNNTDDQPSKEFLGLKDFFSIFVKIVGTLTGFAALFVLFGYTIILTFIIKMQLYGLTSFPQEFYKEATLKFIGDIFGCYGRHPLLSGTIIIAVFTIVFIFIKLRKTTTNIDNKVAGFVAFLFTFAIILITLRLEIIPEKFVFLSETKKIFLFMVSVPVLIGTFVYLALRFSQFVKSPYRFYYLTTLFSLCLFVSIPVGYGDHIYDIEIYPVEGFDYADGMGIESVKTLKKDIDTQGKGTLFFLMGHTIDWEIFFDNQSLTPPAKMILIDRNLIKFLRISRDNINTLRNILQKPVSMTVVPNTKADIKINRLPAKIQQLIEETGK